MSKQWQIRRGTAAENDIFTGAQGEVTMCTDTNELRVHDGVTQGGFEVPVLVAVQRPTADNGYTWYRKYSDGWVEQGGFYDKGSIVTDWPSLTVAYPITMADTNYVLLTQAGRNNADTTKINNQSFIISRTINAFIAEVYGDGGSQFLWWQVSGMAA